MKVHLPSLAVAAGLCLPAAHAQETALTSVVMSGALPTGDGARGMSQGEEEERVDLAMAAPAAVAEVEKEEAPAVEKIDFLQRSNLILAKLLENDRAIDPFGMAMDPANASPSPYLSDQYADTDEKPQAVVDSSSLRAALQSLPITGVYPRQQTIVIGARAFSVGNQFGMKYQDITIRLCFEGIRGGEMIFKDMETRETASIAFNPRPPEFEPLSKQTKPQASQGIEPMNELFIAN